MTQPTERALQLARREAWVAAKVDEFGESTPLRPNFDREAVARYPLPKTVVPREETFGEYSYRVVDGQLQYRSRFREGWEGNCYPNVNTVADAKRLLDLFKNPTEERESDE